MAEHFRLKFRPTVNLSNNGTTYVYDTTQNDARGSATSPGPAAGRGRYQQGTSAFHVAPVTQPVTVFCAELKADGTWQVVNNNGAGDVVAAGDYQQFVFRPTTEDHRVYVTNGASGPSALSIGGGWKPERSAS